MTTARPRADRARRSVLARTILTVAVAVVAFSGCACERPKRVPAMGTAVPLVRVRLGTDVEAVAVAVKGPWQLVGGSGEIASGKDLDWTRVSVEKGAIVFGSVATIKGPAELVGTSDDPVRVAQTVDKQSRGRRYRGRLRLAPVGPAALRLVNVLPMEAYLAGVLACELPGSWHVEAFKAQCIAARTYALISRNTRTRYDFDVYDSTSSQVYGGMDRETAKTWEAVSATRGVVAAYGDAAGKPVLLRTYYSSTCGGETASAGSAFGGGTPVPLAGGVACTYCGRSPKYRWPEVVLTKRQVGDALRRSGSASLVKLGDIQRVEVAERTSRDGRAQRIRVVDAAGQSVLLRAGYWRILMGAGKVPSTWFEIEDRGDRIALTGGRGYGHGVGMCQWGAGYLAAHGKTGEEIIRYYYPKVDLVKAY